MLSKKGASFCHKAARRAWISSWSNHGLTVMRRQCLSLLRIRSRLGAEDKLLLLNDFVDVKRAALFVHFIERHAAACEF